MSVERMGGSSALYAGIGVFQLGAYGSATEASALVFTLMASEAVKTFLEKATRKYSTCNSYIPSWMALIWLVAISILVPGASILGHFCGLIVGYLYACHYFRLLKPPETMLGKVESTLESLLPRATFYIFLENRIEMNHMELLLTSVGSSTQSTLREATPMSVGSGSGFTAAGPGRVLGPLRGRASDRGLKRVRSEDK
ncbi:unnamed protein product [Tuber aestivum]|uniref:Peptidase S54 rhomboid domain-containing protein n=1 Tax=Tuber aestivum TaxID=59557 RepID=A0A292PPZ3_9PEZI|nr:unnamed protein product [Tuber aestivum]